MTSRKLHALTVRRLLAAVALFVFTACGGITVFDDGPAGGTGGGSTTSTGSGFTKCTTGECGDACTRCEGADCKAGRCDKSLTCVVASTVPTCN